MSVFFSSFLKILGFLFALLFFLIFLLFSLNFLQNKQNSLFTFYKGNPDSNEKIAILKLSGPIITEPRGLGNFNILNYQNAIYPSSVKKYLEDLSQKKILGLIIDINSPGGSVTASQEIYNDILNFKKKEKIPIYFHTDEVLASGSYWIAQSGDKIYASYGSILGSIGVKGPDWLYYNTPKSISTGILGFAIESNNGIKKYSNIAGKSKDIFNPFRKPTEEESLKLQKMVNDIYNDFTSIVSKSRKIENEFLKEEIGAMIFNTKQAEKNFLIDGEKNIQETIDKLMKELKLESKLILINKTNNYSNILNFENYLNFYSQNIKANDKIIIDQFCYNLSNGFSSAVISSYNKC